MRRSNSAAAAATKVRIPRPVILALPVIISLSFLCFLSLLISGQHKQQQHENDESIPFLLSHNAAAKTNASMNGDDIDVGVGSSAVLQNVAVQVSAPKLTEIEDCPKDPWKPSENLVGSCPGALKPYNDAQTNEQCARDCCHTPKCVTWQFRQDVGCLHGPDVRLGMEKDGVRSWCSDQPPQRWQGQYVLKRANGKIVQDREATGACSTDTWNPDEQPGQCFGLGDAKKEGTESARACMEACCRKDDCGAWQWQKDLGCFYHKRMHGCVDTSDPVVFEPFVGRRKFQPERKYVDKRGNAWAQNLRN